MVRGDSVRNEFDVQVGLVTLLEGLLDGSGALVLGHRQLVVLAADVLVDQEALSVFQGLLVHFLHCLLGRVVVLEAHVSVVLEFIGLLVHLDFDRSNFSKALKH